MCHGPWAMATAMGLGPWALAHGLWLMDQGPQAKAHWPRPIFVCVFFFVFFVFFCFVDLLRRDRVFSQITENRQHQRTLQRATGRWPSAMAHGYGGGHVPSAMGHGHGHGLGYGHGHGPWPMGLGPWSLAHGPAH